MITPHPPQSQADGYSDFEALTPSDWHCLQAVDQLRDLVREFGIERIHRWLKFAASLNGQTVPCAETKR